jgi:hypothetical protein
MDCFLMVGLVIMIFTGVLINTALHLDEYEATL